MTRAACSVRTGSAPPRLATSLRSLHAAASPLLSGIEDPDQLWRGEGRFWAQVESDGAALLRRGEARVGSVVAVVGLLGADAWRTRAALELAAFGGGDLDGVLDAVA